MASQRFRLRASSRPVPRVDIVAVSLRHRLPMPPQTKTANCLDGVARIGKPIIPGSQHWQLTPENMPARNLAPHAQVHRFNGSMARFLEWARSWLGHALLVDGPAAQTVLPGGLPGEERRPVDFRKAHGPGARQTCRQIKTRCVCGNPPVWQSTPVLWGRENFSVCPGRCGKIGVARRQFDGAGLKPNLDFR